MYKVVTYEIKTGLFGANTAKSDAEMEQFLNKTENDGWCLVSMTEMNTDSRSFIYKMVFKKA